MIFNLIITARLSKHVANHVGATLFAGHSFILAGRPHTGARGMKPIKINQKNKVWVEDFDKRNAPR